MTDKFTPKQIEEIRAFKNNEFKRINLYDGSVRSGKTWISLVLWCLWVGSRKDGYNYLMVGKSITALKRNVLDLAMDIFSEGDITYNLSTKQANIFGKRVYLEGANDARSESKIRGMTLYGAYCDELTLFPEDFFKMLLTRLSVPNAKLFATTNPDNPNHWLMKDYIEKRTELDLRYTKFLIDDNTTLPTDYIENMKKEFSGVFYERFILGRWKIAEGLIYPMFNEEYHVVPTEPRPYELYYISNDFGTQHPMVMQLFGLYEGVWYMIKDYYHEGQKGIQKTVDDYYKDLIEFSKGYKVKQFITDNAPIASSFNIHMRRKKEFKTRKADNEVLPGIQDVATSLSRGIIKFNDCCENTIKEFGLYSWDKESYEDIPLKENDDAMDCLRYFIRTMKIVREKRKTTL